MKIRSITLQNFLCYYGTNNVFEFGNGLNIVLGANGYGKSKLFDAFQWVFNDVENSSITKTLRGNLVSEKAKSEADIGEMIETKVVLEVESKSGTDNFQLIRTYKITKGSDGKWNEPEKSTFKISKKDVEDFKPIAENNYNSIMERLIPTDVRPYVWFQGEQGVSKLIDTRDSVSLKNLVRRLSNIDRWDKYNEVAKKAHLTANNAFNKASTDSDKNKDEINRQQKRQSELTRDIQRIETTIDEFKHNLRAAQEIRDKLTANLENAQLLEKLKNEKNQIDSNLRETINRIDTFYEGYSKRIFTENWLLNKSDFLIDLFEDKLNAYNEQKSLEKAAANLLEKIENEDLDALPEGIPEPMHIKKMLLQERCLICYRPATKGTPEWKAIESRLLKPKIKIEQKITQNFFPIYNRIYRNGLELKNSINNIDDSIKQALEKLNTLNANKRQLEDDLMEKNNEIQLQLQMNDLANPRDIINSFNSSNQDADKYNRLIGKEEGELKRKKEELANISERLDKLSEGQVPEYLRIKKNILQDLIDLSERTKQNKYEELIQLLEDKTNEHYKNINAPTGAFYGKVRFEGDIKNGYRPIIIDKNTRDVTGTLNTSQLSSMKISIIMAVMSANRNRGYNTFYPLIADAPVSDFDDVKISTFLKETANTFGQSIVILKEMLEKDLNREARYIPNYTRLRALENDIASIGKLIHVFQLDMPDGISKNIRSEIEINIKKIQL